MSEIKRPTQNTREDIFPNDKQKTSIIVNRNEKLTRKKLFTKIYDDNVRSIISQKDNDQKIKKNSLKPCNNNYKVIYNEARKNAGVRYYFEKNFSQFDIL